MIHAIYITAIAILIGVILFQKLIIESKDTALEYIKNDLEHLKDRYEDAIERIKRLNKSEENERTPSIFEAVIPFIKKFQEDFGIKENPNKTLQEQLDEAIENEDFERAEAIKRIMDKNKEE